MTTPAFGGCVWPMNPACATAEWDALAEPTQELALEMASATLSRLTGYRVSNCPITVRPVSDRGPCAPYPWQSGSAFQPTNWAGEWFNRSWACTTRFDECKVRLPRPVGPVTRVKVDGDVIDTADYHVETDTLAWIGTGECPWPVDQDVDLPDTEEGTFSVTYLNAYPVDSLGAYAAGVLALEFGKACEGNDCELPENVTSIVRQGVSLEVVAGSFPNGETGLRAVDSFIGLWNPGHLRQQAVVINPNRVRPRARR